ncbi:hypothetical protein MKW94_015868 [Papaver nudicaule]|uniref:Uncharacterized protein n=1 Tax=Papaver nudicaule TaxID=74823 RepID=A0AA41V3E7_PAPNU|nr:hypothetical protein [Papaver nudicaule]
MVFTIASHYVSRPVSYISIIHAIPSILNRLLITSIYALPLVIGAYLANFAYLSLIHAIPKMNVIPIIFTIIYGVFITIVDAHIIVFWNFANVISVLEPNVHGLSAMKRSRQLLPGIGNTFMAIFLVCLYLFAADVILIMGNLIMHMNIHITVRILLVAFWVIIMGGGLNFVGLIGQSALYYECKSYHKQVIDKKVLSEYLHGMESGSHNSTEGNNIEV